MLPCGRFGTKAAWFRLALPAELIAERPKRLRFLIFNTPGRLVHHARQIILRLTHGLNRFGNWLGAMAKLPSPSTA